MDRVTVWPGAIPLETDILSTNRNLLIALGFLIQDLLGASTVVAGFACTPGTGLTVSIAPGRIYSLQNLDSTAYSSLAADTVHQIMKQGILLDAATLDVPAPATSGDSIDYLIEAAYVDVDVGDTILDYYDADNPTQPYTGPNNTGEAQPTGRAGQVNLIAKAGTAAATGTQTAPAADSGFVGLFVVTIAHGASSVVTGDIATAAGAPVIASPFGAQ
ncbi:MAG: hypothetical protein ACREUT_10535 [Steroidobacteraceae bacterium]